MNAFYSGRTKGVTFLIARFAISWGLLEYIAFSARAGTAYYNFTGAFTDGTETQSFLFNTSGSLRQPAPFALRTWHYDGVPFPPGNAAGDPVAAGGFDPQLWLYNDTPALVVKNDDGPTGLDSLITWGTTGMPEQLPADNYQLNLVAYNGTLFGRDGHWAVELLADPAKFTLTGMDKLNDTGATTITSLAMGSNDVRLPAKLQLDQLKSLTIAGALTVGDAGGGDVRLTTASLLTGGGAIGYSNSYLGFDPGSLGNVTLSLGASWTNSQTDIITVGWQGEGNLSVESGSLASFAGPVALAEYLGSEGNVTVTGNNSFLVTNASLHIGEAGAGYLRIADRGVVNSTAESPFGGDFVAFSSTSSGTVDVDGKDSQWSTDELVVGEQGRGTVRISTGGRIATTGSAYVGQWNTAHDSSVTLTGAALDDTRATWTVSGDLFLAGDDTNPSNAANTRLAINTGALVDVAGTTTVWNGGGNLDLLGGELETGSLVVKPGAAFTHTDGTLTIDGGTFDPGTGIAGYAVTGANASDHPKLILTNGASASLPGGLAVGQELRGEVVVTEGAVLSANEVYVSNFSGAAPASSLTVSGTGARVVATGVSSNVGSIEVAGAGPGELVISKGGRVVAQQDSICLACNFTVPLGSGRIVVENRDSVLEATAFGFSAAGGNCYVRIQDRAALRVTGGPATGSSISPLSEHAIDVEVIDGSSLEISRQRLVVSGHGGGTARLTIRNGSEARVTEDLWLHGGSQGSAFVNVYGDEAGTATVGVDGTVYVGGDNLQAIDGTAKLKVANGGQVTADSVKVWQPGTVELDGGILSTSNLELAGGTLQGNGAVLVSGQVANSGVVSPGLSAGVITIAGGNFVQTSEGTLAIEIGGTNPFQYDQVNVTSGQAYLNGTLDVSLIDPTGGTNPYVPNAGDVFHIVTAAGNVGFSPNWTVLPTLRGGLLWGLGTPTPQSLDLSVGGVLGDYNRNGVVDAADYVFWRDLLDHPTSPSYYRADGDGNGYLDVGDYDVWRANFGQTAGSGASLAGTSASDAIPEPATLWLAMLGVAYTLIHRFARRSSTDGRLKAAGAVALVLLCFVNSHDVQADTFGSGANAFTVNFVDIGNAGNSDDAGEGGGLYSSPYGGVAYAYRMGVTEVPQDWITKATNLGMNNVAAGAWTGNWPAAYMTWYECAAFVNWLNTSTGHQPAYNLFYSGGWSMDLWGSEHAWQLGGQNLYRHRGAYYFLPSEDEWYKAAYHQNDGMTANYWDYATGSNIPPTPGGGTTAGRAWYNGIDAFPTFVENVGGASSYGTRGQNGNVWEWNESALDGVNDSPTEVRGMRGGAWGNSEFYLRPSYRSTAHQPQYEDNYFGFRIASAPELLPGDYNHDGVVDAADYVVWRKGLGTIYTATNYDTWRDNFGRSAGGSAMSNVIVPEPATAMLVLLGAVIACWRLSLACSATSERRLFGNE